VETLAGANLVSEGAAMETLAGAALETLVGAALETLAGAALISEVLATLISEVLTAALAPGVADLGAGTSFLRSSGCSAS